MLSSLIGKNLLQRPLRYVLTGLSIAFGVAAVTAVFIFTDGLRETFDELGGDIQSGFDIAVKSDAPFGDNLAVPPVPVELADSLAQIDGVVSAQPRIIEFGVVPTDAQGEAFLAQGPNIGLNWEGRTPNPRLFVADGREPTGPGEFALDVTAFDDGDFDVGGTYAVLTPEGAIDMELVGSFTFASQERNASVGAVLVAFEEDEALRLLNGGRGYDDIVLVVEGEPSAVLPEIEALISVESETLVAVDQQELIDEQQEGFGQFLSIFQTVLLVFAVIILIVSAFLIFNVFTITLGQRIKELGLLRSIGALGSQVTTMMLGEALILGVLATAVGIPAGWLLARALRFGLSQFGFPGDSGLPIQPQTLLYAVLVGVVVTILAALFPSIRARQVTPMAALRDSTGTEALDVLVSDLGVGWRVFFFGGTAVTVFFAALRGDSWAILLFVPIIGATLAYFGVRSLGARFAVPSKFLLLVIGLAVLTIVRFADLGLGPTFGLLGAGALLTILGASQVSALVASPSAKAIGFPIPLALIVGAIGVAFGVGAIAGLVFSVVLLVDGNIGGAFLPIGSLIAAVGAYGLIRTAAGAFGLTGRLARDNAARNPSRTATTATALMIGLALVTTVTVIGESIKDSVTDALSSAVTADWLIQGPQNGPTGLPFSTEVVERLEALDEVDEIVPYRFTFSGFVALAGADADQVAAGIPSLFAALGDRDDDPGTLDDVQESLGATDLYIDDLFSTDFATVVDQIDPDFVDLDMSVDPSKAIWLEDSVATDRGLTMGDTFVAVFIDGAVVELTVSAIYEDGFIFGERVVDNALWEAHLPSDTYGLVSATTTDGVDEEVARSAIEATLLEDYPVLTIQDRSEVAADAEDQINQTLAVVNVLLLLSAVIAILGIAIALSLAVFERTREIGLLRAVGTTRQQTRWIVRWEGVIVAAFGGIVGVIVGVGLGVLATQKLPEFLVTTTSVPIPQLMLYIVVAAVTGIGAGAFPAWIAGRMDVLDAISNE